MVTTGEQADNVIPQRLDDNLSKTDLRVTNSKNEYIFESKHIKIHTLRDLGCYRKREITTRDVKLLLTAFVFCFSGIRVACPLSSAVGSQPLRDPEENGHESQQTQATASQVTLSLPKADRQELQGGQFQPTASWGSALQDPFPQCVYLAGRNTRSDSRALPRIRSHS